MKTRLVTVPIPLTLAAPDSWKADWHEDGAVYQELFHGDGIEEAVERSYAMCQSLLGERGTVEKIASNGLRITYNQSDVALSGICAELLLQMEVRNLLAPGVYAKMIELLQQPRPIGIPIGSLHFPL